MIKLIVFDIWYTLIYYEKNNKYPSFSENMKKTFNLSQSGKEIRNIGEEVIQSKTWKNREDAYKAFLKKLKVKATQKNIKKALEMRDLSDKKKIYTYSHVIPTFKHLKKKNYKIGILSNCCQFNFENIKQNTSFLKYVDHLLPSFKAGVIKPSSKIFKKMEKLSNLKPTEIMMIGDSFSCDIAPAMKRGWKAIQYKEDKDILKEIIENT